jgi:hypothetical protein
MVSNGYGRDEKIRLALVRPKPKEFVIACDIGKGSARWATMRKGLKRFYERAGIHDCPVDPMMMMITLAEVEKNLSPPSAS